MPRKLPIFFNFIKHYLKSQNLLSKLYEKEPAFSTTDSGKFYDYLYYTIKIPTKLKVKSIVGILFYLNFKLIKSLSALLAENSWTNTSVSDLPSNTGSCGPLIGSNQ